MPKIGVENPVPETIRPYQFHGVQLNWQKPERGAHDEHYAMGDCPLCGKDDKFHVEIETGQFGCFKCQDTGNIYTFLKWLHDQSMERTKEYHAITVDRKLINGVGLVQWGVCRSILTNDWIVPAYNQDGSLNQLYRYMNTGKRMTTVPTPLGHHGLHGVPLYRPENLIVFLNEGWSDGVALYEVLLQTKQDGEGNFHLTGRPENSLMNDASILACPTASVFNQSWLPLFAGKVVNLMFDNDHPIVNQQTGKEVLGAGLTGMRRIARMLAGAHNPPEQINFLEWGELGYNKDFKSGYDVRDHLNA